MYSLRSGTIGEVEGDVAFNFSYKTPIHFNKSVFDHTCSFMCLSRKPTFSLHSGTIWRLCGPSGADIAPSILHKIFMGSQGRLYALKIASMREMQRFPSQTARLPLSCLRWLFGRPCLLPSERPVWPQTVRSPLLGRERRRSATNVHRAGKSAPCAQSRLRA